MINYINGYAYPRVHVMGIQTIPPRRVTTFDLDLCMLGEGFVEDYEEDFKRVTLEKNSRIIDYDFRGSRIRFTLDYSTFARKENLFKIEQIFGFNSRPEDYKIYLTPRADVMDRNFEVRLETGAYSLGILKKGISAGGNRLPVIKFITVYPVNKNFIDSSTVDIPLPFHMGA